ncbi:MAG: hypothetical protein EHM36_06745, partial [Deltaproteobacteria bacterium]
MDRFRTATIVVLFVFLGTAGLAFNADFKTLSGTWEYTQKNSTTETGFDPQGERLELLSQTGTLKGIYHGLEREGEHGLFYSIVEIEELQVSASGI